MVKPKLQIHDSLQNFAQTVLVYKCIYTSRKNYTPHIKTWQREKVISIRFLLLIRNLDSKVYVFTKMNYGGWTAGGNKDVFQKQGCSQDLALGGATAAPEEARGRRGVRRGKIIPSPSPLLLPATASPIQGQTPAIPPTPLLAHSM